MLSFFLNLFSHSSCRGGGDGGFAALFNKHACFYLCLDRQHIVLACVRSLQLFLEG